MGQIGDVTDALSTLDRLLEKSKRSCACRSVDTLRCWPRGHLGGERHKEEHTAADGRVDNVLTKAAESHLANADCEDGADDNNPQRKVGGKVESKDETGHNGRAISDSGRDLKDELLNEILDTHAGNDRSQDDGERTESEEPERCGQSRDESNRNAKHVTPHRIGGVDMWRWCYG